MRWRDGALPAPGTELSHGAIGPESGDREKGGIASRLDIPLINSHGPMANFIDLTLPPALTLEDAANRLRARLRASVLAALVAIVVLNVLDVVTTRAVLAVAHGHGLKAVESNPLARALLAGYRVDLLKAALLLVLGLRVIRGSRTPSLAVVCCCWFVAGIYAMTIVSNGFAWWALVR